MIATQRTSADLSSMSSRRRATVLASPDLARMLIVTLIALLLRAYGISKESLWLDETASVAIASQPLSRVLAGELTNPPLYYVLLHLWVKLFGSGEAAIRWLSVWPSLVAIALTYVLALRLYDRRVATITAVFMAVSPYQIYYAQEARAFPLLLALLLGSTLSFHVALARPPGSPSLHPWLWYFFTTVAALHTHFHAIFVVAAHHLFILLYWRDHRPVLRRWIMIQAALAAAFAPWFTTMLKAGATTGGQLRRHIPLKLPQALFSFLAGDSAVPFDEAAVQQIPNTLLSHWHLILAFAVGFGIYLAAALRAAPANKRATAFSAVMFLVPLLIPFLISFKLVIFDRRYVIAASPILYIVLATGASSLHAVAMRSTSRLASAAHLTAAALIVTLVSTSSYNYYFNPRFGREQWREVVAYVEANYGPRDVVLFDPSYIGMSYNYYSRRFVRELTPGVRIADREHQSEWRDALHELTAYDRVWLVRSHLFTDALLTTLQQLFPSVSRRHFPRAKGIDVYLMQR